MIFIQHRLNKIKDLRLSNQSYGVEIDVRNHGSDLYVVHDPFSTKAVKLADWLKDFNHPFLIVNVKEEGLEPLLLDMLEDANVLDFFILDETIPYIRKYALEGIPNFAVRVSEFESTQTALNLAAYLKTKGKRVDWIWIDTFTGALLPESDAIALKSAGFKLCQVSPELHHIDNPKSWTTLISNFKLKLAEVGPSYILPDMICSKHPEIWAEF